MTRRVGGCGCSLFERAMAAAGLDFRSDKLWEMYMKWEKENGDLHRVTALYDRLLTIPTQHYRHHFDWSVTLHVVPPPYCPIVQVVISTCFFPPLEPSPCLVLQTRHVVSALRASSFSSTKWLFTQPLRLSCGLPFLLSCYIFVST